MRLSVEYILTAFWDRGQNPTNFYQFILTYDSDAPALFSTYHFNTRDEGAFSTIGVQGIDVSNRESPFND